MYIIVLVIGAFALYYYLNHANNGRKRQNTSHNHPPKNEKTTKDIEHYEYRPKRLMTHIEKRFYKAICDNIDNSLIVLPQVNLATIIEKVGNHRWQTELYRNIDFVVFDADYNAKLLIEINDATHNQKDRQERDMKVAAIAASANIPIVTFYPKYDVNPSHIRKTIEAALHPTLYENNGHVMTTPQSQNEKKADFPTYL